jgi:D-amino-acid dehydrogenase
MKVLVMGAGLAGVTTAWFLAGDGHEVVVVEREPAVASAASYANGGIVAASRPFPWPGPQMLATVFKALSPNDQAVRLRWQLDPWFWLWGLRFLANCTSKRYGEILRHKLRLVRYSQQVLGRLVQDTGLEYQRLTNGVLYLYRDAGALETGWARAESARPLGIATERLSPAEVARLEPGVAVHRLAGAILAPGDEAGDSAQFCRELAKRCERQGVVFRLATEIRAVEAKGVDVKAVLSQRERFDADAFVCALGVIDPALRGCFEADLPIYPVKGFSATGRIARPDLAPRRPGIDESKSIAYCPLGERIRLTGGAEFAGYARTSVPEDFARMHRAFEQLYPGAADFSDGGAWVCQRPMTPESTPRFGKGRYANLWFNVGHGHMGWAMAAGSAKITADLVSGREPEIGLEGLRVRS